MYNKKTFFFIYLCISFKKIFMYQKFNCLSFRKWQIKYELNQYDD